MTVPRLALLVSSSGVCAVTVTSSVSADAELHVDVRRLADFKPQALRVYFWNPLSSTVTV